MSLVQPYVTRTAWLRVAMLALAAFIFNTTEYAPVGLLTDISTSFGMQVGQVGMMLTIYAWVVALLSLPAMLITRQVERRRLLRGIFLLFIASHMLSAIAWSYTALVVSRIGIALAHAAFWSITAALVVRVAPPERKQQALALLATGTVMAMVMGVPLGRVIGDAFGWRMTFSLIATAAALTLYKLMQILPELPSKNTGSLSHLPILLKRPMLVTLLLLTILVITAHFTAYSYIEPFSDQIAQLSGIETTLVLLVFGGAGIIGSWLFSLFNANYPEQLMIGTLMAMLLSLLALPWVLQLSALLILVVVWGAAIMSFGLLMQSRILELATDATDVSMSLYSGLYNVGIGGGALLGGIIAQHYGLRWIGLWGGALCALAVALYLGLSRRFAGR
ncbi:sugar transporter [Frateuria aurantia]